jgi:preprotein translocase subunit SecF
MKYNFDFVSKFPITVILSIVLVLGSLALFFGKGLNYGVDFRGGSEIQIRFDNKVELQSIRSALKEGGFSSSQVQRIGEPDQNEYLVKVAGNENEDLNLVTDKITTMFTKDFANDGPEIRKTDIVGPKAGKQLRISGFQAMAWALLVIMVYIGLRFDYKYSPGAIVALLHDVIIIVGVFVLIQKEFSLQIVGALLAVIGYSVNDTVVVYDRVRENEEKAPGTKLKGIINKALNETLSRTILTSVTTFLVAAVMFVMGGGVIHDFFFAICLGVLIGTYSSIFVAAPTTMFFERFQNKN